MNDVPFIETSSQSKLTTIRPQFFTTEDTPWIVKLAGEISGFQGRPLKELLSRLKEPFFFDMPKSKARIAIKAILKNINFIDSKDIDSKILREELFTAFTRDRHVQSVLKKYALNLNEVRDQMFSDFANNRVIAPLEKIVDHHQIISEANQLTIKREIFQAQFLQIYVVGDVRRIICQAKLDGLTCEIYKIDGKPGVILRISGQFTIIKNSKLYGPAFCKILSFLSWAEFFTLKARCEAQDKAYILQLQSGDPIRPNDKATDFDSKIEEDFARKFLKFKDKWDLVREAEPIEIDHQKLIFPDFKIISRFDPNIFYFVEIVGFWTEEYLTKNTKVYLKSKI